MHELRFLVSEELGKLRSPSSTHIEPKGMTQTSLFSRYKQQAIKRSGKDTLTLASS